MPPKAIEPSYLDRKPIADGLSMFEGAKFQHKDGDELYWESETSESVTSKDRFRDENKDDKGRRGMDWTSGGVNGNQNNRGKVY